MSVEITLSIAERIIIANQLEIFRLLDNNRTDELEQITEIVQNGYTTEYHKVLGYLHKEEFPMEVAIEVREILQMFQEFTWHTQVLSINNPRHNALISFWGFDGNNSHDHLKFASHLLRHGEYQDLNLGSGCPNSHSDTLETMRCMVRAWKSIGRKGLELTADDILLILDAPLIENLPLPDD